MTDTERFDSDYNVILQAVSRGWCSPENSHKEVDVTLAIAIANEVNKAWQARARDERCGELLEAAKEAQDALAATKHLLLKYAEEHNWLTHIRKAIDRQAKAVAAFEASHETQRS